MNNRYIVSNDAWKQVLIYPLSLVSVGSAIAAKKHNQIRIDEMIAALMFTFNHCFLLSDSSCPQQTV